MSKPAKKDHPWRRAVTPEKAAQDRADKRRRDMLEMYSKREPKKK